MLLAIANPFSSRRARLSPTQLRGWLACAGVFVAGATAGTEAVHAAAPAEDGIAFFESKVRPLLIDKCYNCHSPEHKVKGGLRLDTKEGTLEGGDSGPSVVPKEPDKSLLLRAVTYEDRDLKMPPKQKLTAEEVDIIRQWIAMGAPDPREDKVAAAAEAAKPAKQVGLSFEAGRQFWSFKLPVKTAPPAVHDTAWTKSDTDRFILAKLEEKKLTPAPDAAAEVLLRRVYHDLVGLLPSSEDTAEFLRNPDVSKLVDKLMATPQFGEQWGQHWLDLSRFAESSGGGRTLPFKDAWRFRDYVIESINNDVPLSRFITEQIAGDLLPHANAEERRRHMVATGFLVLGPTNYEEQDKGVLRMDIVDEQLDTLGRSFMGMTMSCARCHDHKFDPIPAADYYALAGILRSTRTLKNYTDNVAHWIDSPLPLDGAQETEMQAKETKLASMDTELAAAKKALKKMSPKPVKLQRGQPVELDDLPGIVVDDSQAKRVGNWKESNKYPSFIGEGYVHDVNTGKGTCTITFSPTIPKAGRYEVRLAYMALVDRSKKVPVTILHADGEETVYVDQSETPPIDGRFISLGQFRFEKDGAGYVLLSNEGTKGYVTADAVVFIPVEELDKPGSEEKAAKDPKLVAMETKVKALEKEIKVTKSDGLVRPEAMTVLDDTKPEDCAIHIRGSIRNLGQVVPRGFLAVATYGDTPKIPADQSGRLQLAEWVTSDRNPLTARVLVNRVWMHLFGDGLVRSVDNFGTTGEKPSHPELLDALAIEFMQDGWNLKRLVKRLMLTRAYQMASIPTAEQMQAGHAEDPENRLLWKQNRRRVDAGVMRDAILTVSGTINMAVGGPNVIADSVDSNSGGAQNLEYGYIYTDTRRSVYTPAFRNKRLDLFDAFDFADINQPIAKRNASTVAPQALFMMNHPFVIEQSRKAAELIMQRASATDTDVDLVNRLYQQTLGRQPTAGELKLAVHFVKVNAHAASEEEVAKMKLENWALLVQTLFASVDFRYVN
ncbi:DUF1553 domain-containing protein [Roseimicrobium sp. ORNL1]|uniref:DUF1553 domain-containing protein n=1 Tax=Roseimicrobium sp. ORNL1 TaxID=2711231 RepID=UPI0013E13E1C|nr:DUF1553 domain-containing protein [Roseimicrobium sp. ORNL1]QIF02147.1 DUF1553 domain-containing protein [Roseimicrobium sp. ORNL1]